MVVLDVLSIVVAVVALAFGVVAIVSARGANDRAALASAAVERAERAAAEAQQASSAASARSISARNDASAALDRATSADESVAVALDAARQGVADSARALETAQRLEAAAAAAAAAEATSIEGPPAGDGHGAVHTGSAADDPNAPADPDQHAVVDDADRQAVAASAVRWALQQVKGASWIVRNSGTAVAHAALVSDITQPPKYVRPDEVIPRDVAPGDHLQLKVTGGRGTPPPRVRVSWRDDGNAQGLSTEFTILTDD